MLMLVAGLIGVVFAGMVADAAITAATAEDEPDEDEDGAATPQGTGPDAQAAGRLTDWPEDATPSLDGGSGDDRILAGPGDVVTGSAGQDVVQVAGWEATEGPARITDFDASQEQIVVLYDPATHPDPVLDLVPCADGSGTVVLLDGLPVAELAGVDSVQPGAISLMPEVPEAA